MKADTENHHWTRVTPSAQNNTAGPSAAEGSETHLTLVWRNQTRPDQTRPEEQASHQKGSVRTRRGSYLPDAERLARSVSSV